MRTAARLVLAGALAGTAFLAPAAQADPLDCVWDPCYNCYVEPCGLRGWYEYVNNHVRDVCVDAAGVCV